ncbi:MAG: leucine-rich repeat protein [Clostridia bacterium]|nr:leucine-rich repeat protein [Clostridia bacterium]
MKKIIFTLTILSVLFCLLAISVGAATTNEFGEVEIVTGMSEKPVFGNDGRADTYTSRVVMFDGTEYHTYPAYYIFTNNVNTTTDFSQLNELAKKSYGKTSVIRAEVPQNVQKVTGDIFMGYNDLKYVRFPDTLTQISGNMFNTSHGLEWVNVPRDCVSIGGYAFYGCSSLVTIDMSNAKSLKRTEANQFYNCPNLKELIFPQGFEYFGGAGGGGANQAGLGSLKTLYLPNSVTYMGSISEAKSLTSITVPLGVTSIKAKQFCWSPGINQVVLHSGITSIAPNALDMTLYLTKVVYTGQETDSIVDSIKTAFSGATITYGNQCNYYYNGEHLDNTNPCVINCTRCGSVNVPKENPNHNVITSISYLSFDAKGTKVTSCTNEGCKYAVTEDAPSLFVCKGYSASKTGVDGIALGFEVNNKAINEYETITGKTLNYGVFAVAQAKLGGSDIFNENGNAIKGAITADLTNYEFSTFEVKVVGFADDQKGLDLAMGAYVKVTKNGETEYSYMQATENGDKIGNYYFVCYNDIVK